jgi:hypothetical protein
LFASSVISLPLFYLIRDYERDQPNRWKAWLVFRPWGPFLTSPLAPRGEFHP